MKIRTYLKKFCNNNKAEFGRRCSRIPQIVQRMFKKENIYRIIELDTRKVLVTTFPQGVEIFIQDGVAYQVRAEITE